MRGDAAGSLPPRTGVLFRSLIDQRDLDAAVFLSPFEAVVLGDGLVFSAARGDHALRRYAYFLQIAHDGGRARDRQFPVGWKDLLQRFGDRHVVGMADDTDDLVLVAFQRLADFFEDRLAGVLEVSPAGIEEQ